MKRWRIVVAVTVCLCSLSLLTAGGDSVQIAKGVVDKAEKETLTVRPRGPDGTFQKSIVLKITGTTQITSLGTRKVGAKMVPVQTAIKASGLEAKQTIAIIYTTGADGPILLSAVVSEK